VLRNPCALTLGDEPLAGRVEHGAVQFWMSLPEFCVPLHNLVHAETECNYAIARDCTGRDLSTDRSPEKFCKYYLLLGIIDASRVEPVRVENLWTGHDDVGRARSVNNRSLHRRRLRLRHISANFISEHLDDLGEMVLIN
jgi:hypothetical protein